MIAQRFRALGWVGGITVAATAFYIVSLQVAAERSKLEDIEGRIVAAQREMRQLQTELGTRASMRQLEKWNAEDLAMATPRAGQYLHSVSQLASLSDRAKVPTVSAPVQVALVASRPKVDDTAPVTPAAPVARVQHASFTPEAAQPRAQRVAVIDTRTLGALSRAAAEERRNKR